MTTPIIPELLPCPFCGEKPEYVDSTPPVVFCNTRWCAIADDGVAVETWNIRHPQTEHTLAMEEALEALEGAKIKGIRHGDVDAAIASLTKALGGRGMASDNTPTCELCGTLMPEGETMFKYHGYSGPCPQPPLPQPKLASLVEYLFVDNVNGDFWIDIRVDRKTYTQIGPFETEAERQRAHDDLLEMTRSQGAQDLPNMPQ